MNRSGVMRHVPSVATAVPGILVRRTASHRVPQNRASPGQDAGRYDAGKVPDALCCRANLSASRHDRTL